MKLRADGEPERDEDEEEPGPKDEPEGDDAMAAHEPLRAEAEAACVRAADAYKASKGSDSAGLLLAAEDAGDEAMEAHQRAKASSAKLRGAPAEGESTEPKPAPSPPPPAPAAPGAVARAVRAVAGADATAQLELTRDAELGRKARAIFGGATHDATEGLMRAAHQDAADAAKLRTAAEKSAKEQRKRDRRDADAALRAELSAAVRAGKYTRAEVFDISEGKDAQGHAVEVLTPKAWLREMVPAARAQMIAAKQARSGGNLLLEPDDTATPVSSAVRDYCARRGITDPKTIAAIAAQMSGPVAAPQETA